ncbi:hypothetical protein AOLI_G00094510 [Acnodon oligacanthus]
MEESDEMELLSRDDRSPLEPLLLDADSREPSRPDPVGQRECLEGQFRGHVTVISDQCIVDSTLNFLSLGRCSLLSPPLLDPAAVVLSPLALLHAGTAWLGQRGRASAGRRSPNYHTHSAASDA